MYQVAERICTGFKFGKTVSNQAYCAMGDRLKELRERSQKRKQLIAITVT